MKPKHTGPKHYAPELHASAKVTIKVDYTTFKKSDWEKERLKELKQGTTKPRTHHFTTLKRGIF
jgi:hypothetical protein